MPRGRPAARDLDTYQGGWKPDGRARQGAKGRPEKQGRKLSPWAPRVCSPLRSEATAHHGAAREDTVLQRGQHWLCRSQETEAWGLGLCPWEARPPWETTHTHRRGAPKSWPGRSAGFRQHPSPALGLPCRKGPAPWAAPSGHPAARGKAELASPDVHGLAQARLSTSRLAQDGVRRRRGPSPRLLRVCSCPGQPFLGLVGTLCPGSRGMLPAWLRVGIWPLLPALGPDALQDHVPAPEHTICSNKHPLVF